MIVGLALMKQLIPYVALFIAQISRRTIWFSSV